MKEQEIRELYNQLDIEKGTSAVVYGVHVYVNEIKTINIDCDKVDAGYYGDLRMFVQDSESGKFHHSVTLDLVQFKGVKYDEFLKEIVLYLN